MQSMRYATRIWNKGGNSRYVETQDQRILVVYVGQTGDKKVASVWANPERDL